MASTSHEIQKYWKIYFRPSVIKTKRNDERRRSSEGVKTEGGLGQGDVMTSPPRFSSAPSKVSGFLTVHVEKANFY